MDKEQYLDLPASKGDIQMILEAIKDQNDFGLETPENPAMFSLWKRLDQIEKATKKAIGVGLADIPIDAETMAAITGLAVGTCRNYGCYRHVDTIRIGNKLQFSLKDCIRIVEAGTRKAVIDCTTDMTNYHRKKKASRKK